MRDRLNKDPKAQMALIAVLLIAGVFIFMSKSGGGEESAESPSTEATVAVAGTGVTSTATGATAGEAVEGAIEGAVEKAEATASTATAPPASAELSSLAAPRLPKPVIEAYKANKTVVLLVVHDGGIDDEVTKLATTTLEGDSTVALFVVSASQIYRYAAITLGVEVSRVPALVVMRPRKLSKGEPQATVSYGVQTPQDIRQAVRDASYDGPGATYHPG
jgi:hypothetical protein